MIQIQNSKDVESEFFNGRNFGDSLKVVEDVLKDVQANGDAAVKKYTRQFDVSCPSVMEIPMEELKKCADELKAENPELYEAICYSHNMALKFAKKQCECFTDFEVELDQGIFTGQKTIPVERAGVYVPAGRFALVSTVVMTVTPAVAAGVKEIILCTPPRVHPSQKEDASLKNLGTPGNCFEGGLPFADKNILAAAYICGVTKAFACGGSQAVAALSFGTESIPKVDVIVGPGNKFVAEAKKLVYGTCGIDMVAGPTEVFIVADESCDAEWVAADLLAQAEHDIVAQPIMATNSMEVAKKVQAEIERQLALTNNFKTASSSVENCGKIIVTETLEEAVELANKKAPEHLELAMEDSPLRKKLIGMCRNYGSLFIGHNAAEVFGDYAAGLNHTLPTSGSARFTGGLSVRMFLKTTTTLRVDPNGSGAKKSAQMSGILGDAEGLECHAKAARIRIGEKIK